MSISTPYSDIELFHRIADGDEAAFKILFRHYSLQLRPFIFSIERSDELTAEVIQETLIRVWLNRDKLSSIKEPKAWICRIAANVLYTYRRKLLADRKATGIFQQEKGALHNEVSDRLDLLQLQAAIRQGVDLLPEQRRRIYLLRREEGLTTPQIATELGLSSNTVRNTLAIASEFIREHLRSRGYTTAAVLVVLSCI